MYARVSEGGLLLGDVADVAGSKFLFVDIDAAGTSSPLRHLDRLRDLPPQLRNGIKQVVVRWPLPITRDLHSRVRVELAHTIREYVSNAELGSSLVELLAIDFGVVRAWRIGANDVRARSSVQTEKLARNARSAEVNGLLQVGNAIENPAGHHFVLPSGRHSGSFVDISRAIRSYRDAEVLALWMLPTLPEDPTKSVGLVVDTPALLAVAGAYRSIEASMRRPAGGTTVLKEYPHAAFEIESALNLTDGDVILPVVSVSASGQLVARIREASGDQEDRNLAPQILVARYRSPGHGADRSASWAEVLEESAIGENCGLCAHADRSTKVTIEPRFLGVRSTPRPRLGMPSLGAARVNREWWELVDRREAVRFDAPPVAAIRDLRSKEWHESLLFDVEALFGSESIAETTKDLQQIVRQRKRPRWLRHADLVLVSSREVDIVGGRAPMAGLVAAVTGQEYELQVVDISAAVPASLSDAVLKAKHPIIFALGIVTGFQVESVLATVTGIRRFEGAETPGLVAIHARGSSSVRLNHLRNPFAEKAEILFSLVVPDDHESPFRSERSLIGGLLDSAQRVDRDVSSFLDARVDSDGGKFWRIDSEAYAPVLRPGSWFGEELSEGSILAAAGSAIQILREAQGLQFGGWHAVDMRAVVDSYFDAVIVASYLRWLRPAENYWGETEADVRATFIRVLEKFTASDTEQSLMLSELLVAAAMGKVPSVAIQVLEDRASSFAVSNPGPVSVPVRAAVAVLRYASGA